jgi:outer membrane translocation and assembly module TamA
MRLADSDWLLGGRYVFLHAESDFGLSLPEPIRPDQLDTDIGRLSLLINYDSRDNILTPSNGLFLEAEYAVARSWLGSTDDFENLNVRGFGYFSLLDDLILGLRADIRIASEETPFFALPYIDLRGVPALRYQDRRSAMLETELRWNFTPRWAAVGFVGMGRAFGRYVDFDEAESIYTRGAGIRYLIARKLGLYTGIDIARGPEENAFYIQLGSAWR